MQVFHPRINGRITRSFLYTMVVMKNADTFIADFFGRTLAAIEGTVCTGPTGATLSRDIGLEKFFLMVKKAHAAGRKVIIIGNGGSSAIASHTAVDLWKNGGIRAVAFNDSSLLTCISNDLGYENVFSAPVEMFADKGDLLVAISSSGKSANILKAAKTASARGCGIVTMSGFGERNPLRKGGEVNFYVPSNGYGFVETAHAMLCHCIVDMVIAAKTDK